MPRNGLNESTSLVIATVRVNGSSADAAAVGDARRVGVRQVATSAPAARPRMALR